MPGARALSPILSTMILLSAALIAGFLLYTYFSSTMQGMINTPSPVIEQAVYYPTIDVLYVKIRNYGGAPVPLENANITIMSKDAECKCSISCPSSLKPSGLLTLKLSNTASEASIPGCTVKCSISTACQESLAAGNAYIVFEYLFGGSVQSTRPVGVTLG